MRTHRSSSAASTMRACQNVRPREDVHLTDQELRVTSDSFLARVERLQALEEQKRELPPEQASDLAHEVEALTREVLEWAERQSALADKAAETPGDGVPIAIQPPRALHTVLEEWRAAERRLATEEPNTAGFESARADIDRLRDEYARAYNAQSHGTSNTTP
jgi:hypothetical protein